MHISSCCGAVSLLAIWFAASAQTAAPARWMLTRRDVSVISVPAEIRESLDALEYDDSSAVRGVMVDLNGDGVKEYIIQSAPTLCGNGGCVYEIFGGASRKSLGQVFGGTLVVGGMSSHGFPNIETVSALSAESSADATYTFDGTAYEESTARVVSGASLDSLVQALRAVPPYRP